MVQKSLASMLACAALACCAQPVPPPKTSEGPPAEALGLRGALLIDAPEDFQPSALALEQGRLLTVSDHDDSVIYELQLAAESARAEPFVRFAPPADGSPERLDYEGLISLGEGRFWLLSEGRYRVLEVVKGEGDRGTARWLTPSVEAVGRAAGLFQVPGGDVEGVAPLPGGGLLIAAERQPRGLIELQPGLGLEDARVWAMPACPYPLSAPRPPDFTDLSLVDGDVYALLRNAHLVVRLERTAQEWREVRGWSYAAVENDPRYRYRDVTFGLGEGLAVSRDEVFIVLDNNLQPRVEAPADRRALLLRFGRPPDLGARGAR